MNNLKIITTIILSFFFCSLQALPTSSTIDKKDVITENATNSNEQSTFEKVINFLKPSKKDSKSQINDRIEKWGKITKHSLLWGAISCAVGVGGIILLYYSGPEIALVLLSILVYVGISLIGIGIISGLTWIGLNICKKLKQRKTIKE